MDPLFSPDEDLLLAELDYSPDRALALNQRLRGAGLSPERAAAVLTQAALRLKARTKFGEEAAGLWLTRAGLEQSTRRVVADRHAARFRAAGLASVADLGCGIGADSRAFLRAGLDATAVEIDPETASAAEHNLTAAAPAGTGRARVLRADLTELDLTDLRAPDGRPVEGLWLDPARREDGTGRSRRLFDPEAFSPPFSVIERLAATGVPMGVKMGPGMDRSAIPAEAEAEWISQGGDVLELVLWFNALATPGVRRRATVLTAGTGEPVAELTSAADFGAGPEAPVAEPGPYLYEPDGAVIRAELVDRLVEAVDGALIDPHIAYATSENVVDLPWATGWRVLERLPLRARDLKAWARREGVGSVTIKKRGVDVVPEQLRKQILAGSGRGKGRHATLVLTRWDAGAGEQRAAFAVEPLGAPA